MTDAAAVSVVVVSRGRPEALRRCLIGLSQLRYAPFEIVIVADHLGRSMLRELPQAAHVKIIAFDDANISAARNLGIEQSDGDIVAFIDDDAVPEPSWLLHLAGPFALDDVIATGGFVRGRNGISWQWQAQSVDWSGYLRPLTVDAVQPTLLNASKDQAVKTPGTNMAVRRTQLVEMGGFDPNFRFFLDETDLNLRLATRQLSTAVVPKAEVHHGYAASDRRRADRVPTDLSEIGASWAVFLRKHCVPEHHTGVWNRVWRSERKRLLRHMVTGALEPRDVRRLMQGLQQGFDAGLARRRTPMTPLRNTGGGFLAYPCDVARESIVIAGRRRKRAKLHRDASAEVAAGRVVTVIKLSLTTRYHKVRFKDAGYWEHSGGQFGKSERNQKVISLQRFAQRVRAEVDRIRDVRLID